MRWMGQWEYNTKKDIKWLLTLMETVLADYFYFLSFVFSFFTFIATVSQ